MKKRVAILQSNYIPWKGYFDIIKMSDVFIFYDDVQYTSGDWRNRNLIKTANGLQWLTIPVANKGRLESCQLINNTNITDKRWARKHWASLQQNYSKAPYFDEVAPIVKFLYEQCADIELLCEVNYLFIRELIDNMGIQTELLSSSDFDLSEDRNLRLIELVQRSAGTHYLSGASAQSYLDTDLFNQHGITIEWMDYSGYPKYPQVYPPFEHGVTILDLLFNTGFSNALKYMKPVME